MQALWIGSSVLCVYIGLLAYIALSTGLPTPLLALYSFGKKGSYLVSFLLRATQIGGLGVGLAIIGSISLGGVNGLWKLLGITLGESMGISAAVGVCVGLFISIGILTPNLVVLLTNKELKQKNKIVIVNSIMGIFFGLILYNNFMTWIGLLNTLVPGIGGVIIADYFIVRKGKYLPMKNMIFTSVNKCAILAWLLGIAGAYFIPGIAAINSVAIAAIAYVGLTQIGKFMRTELGMQNSM